MNIRSSISIRPILKLQSRRTSTQIEKPQMMGMKQKSRQTKKQERYSLPPGQKDEDKGDLPEKKKEYTRGEQSDKFTVYFKIPKDKNQVVLQWYAYRASGSDNVKYGDLIADVRKNKDDTFNLILDVPFIQKRGLPIIPLIDYMILLGKDLGFEIVSEIPKEQMTKKMFPRYINLILSKNMNIGDILDIINKDPNAIYSRGGIAIMWGDYMPYLDDNGREGIQNPKEEMGSKDSMWMDEYINYLIEYKIKTTKKFQKIIHPSFQCLNKVGRMYLRGTCNSSGTYLNITAWKTSKQNFKEFMNYVPDVSVSTRIAEYVEGKSIEKKTKNYIPSSDSFSFQFNKRLDIPHYLKCDFAYSFVKLIETEPIMKLPLKDLPMSCGEEEICLPYMSPREIDILKKLDKLMDIHDFEENMIDYETKEGRRCRPYTFGSDDDEWKYKDAKLEKEWIFDATKKMRYSPRSIKKDNQLYLYQVALDELYNQSEMGKIIEKKQSKIRELRGKSGIY